MAQHDRNTFKFIIMLLHKYEIAFARCVNTRCVYNHQKRAVATATININFHRGKNVIMYCCLFLSYVSRLDNSACPHSNFCIISRDHVIGRNGDKDRRYRIISELSEIEHSIFKSYRVKLTVFAELTWASCRTAIF